MLTRKVYLNDYADIFTLSLRQANKNNMLAFSYRPPFFDGSLHELANGYLADGYFSHR